MGIHINVNFQQSGVYLRHSYVFPNFLEFVKTGKEIAFDKNYETWTWLTFIYCILYLDITRGNKLNFNNKKTDYSFDVQWALQPEGEN